MSHLAGCTYTFATEGVSEVIRVVVIKTTVRDHGQQVKWRNRASSWWWAGVVGLAVRWSVNWRSVHAQLALSGGGGGGWRDWSA